MIHIFPSVSRILSFPFLPDFDSPLPPLPDYLVGGASTMPSDILPPKNMGDDVPF